MSKLIRVCNNCNRPVSDAVRLFFVLVLGYTCPNCGNIYENETHKVPAEKARYD
jgi:predicted RNA-binding Zn-ribbon protein involved in translation (DUF1610 family)